MTTSIVLKILPTRLTVSSTVLGNALAALGNTSRSLSRLEWNAFSVFLTFGTILHFHFQHFYFPCSLSNLSNVTDLLASSCSTQPKWGTAASFALDGQLVAPDGQHDLLDGQLANTNSLQLTSSGDSSNQVANMVHLANNSSSSSSFSLGLNRSLTNISILGNLTANSSLSSSLDETSGGPVNLPLLTPSSSLSSSPENFDALEEILKGPSLTVEKLLPVERCGFASDNLESGDFHSWVRADNAITDICTIW